LKCDGTRAETRFRLSGKRTSPFKWTGASVQSTAGNRGVRMGGSNAGYTKFRGSAKGTGYPLHSPVSPSLPLPASPCAITFQLDSTLVCVLGEFPIAPQLHMVRKLHKSSDLKYVGVGRSIILKGTLKKSVRPTGLILLRKGTSGGPLLTRQRSFGFYKMRGISWPAEELLAFQEGLCCIVRV